IMFPTRRRVPDTARGAEVLAIRAPGQTRIPMQNHGQFVQMLARLRVPEVNEGIEIVAARSQPPTVGRQGQALDPAQVSKVEPLPFPAGGDIPDPDRAVARTRGEDGQIARVPDDRSDRARMSAQAADLLAGLNVPLPQPTVL